MAHHWRRFVALEAAHGVLLHAVGVGDPVVLAQVLEPAFDGEGLDHEAGFGDILVKLLGDPKRAEAIGRAARERVRESFLGARHLMQYLRLIARLIA